MRALSSESGFSAAGISLPDPASIPAAAWDASRPGSPRSTTRTRNPCLRSEIASESPIIPPPRMIASQDFTIEIVEEKNSCRDLACQVWLCSGLIAADASKTLQATSLQPAQIFHDLSLAPIHWADKLPADDPVAINDVGFRYFDGAVLLRNGSEDALVGLLTGLAYREQINAVLF